MTGLLQAETPPVVLASGSVTRAALLRSALVAFEVEIPGVDEAAAKESARADGLSAEDCALLLAELKARRISERRPEALVIGADQILVCGGSWFDKPLDRHAAARQIAALQGRTHTLATAVVCLRGGVRVWHYLALPRLTMRPLSGAVIEAYLDAAGGSVLRNVGGYAIESVGIRLFSAIEGDREAVLGLPLLPLLGFLRQHGVLRD